MKNKCKIYLFKVRENIPVLMLFLILAGIAITTFHHHDCTEESDNCTICRIQHSFYATVIESDTYSNFFRQPTVESLITQNDRVSDPSQKLVCSSHAPPQYTL